MLDFNSNPIPDDLEASESSPRLTKFESELEAKFGDLEFYITFHLANGWTQDQLADEMGISKGKMNGLLKKFGYEAQIVYRRKGGDA